METANFRQKQQKTGGRSRIVDRMKLYERIGFEGVKKDTLACPPASSCGADPMIRVEAAERGWKARAMDNRRGRLLLVHPVFNPAFQNQQDSESLHFIVKARFADLQNLGRFLFIPVVWFKHLHDMTLLHILKAIETSLFRWTGFRVIAFGGRLLDFAGRCWRTYGLHRFWIRHSQLCSPVPEHFPARVGYEGNALAWEVSPSPKLL